jgi:hypothetical protein
MIPIFLALFISCMAFDYKKDEWPILVHFYPINKNDTILPIDCILNNTVPNAYIVCTCQHTSCQWSFNNNDVAPILTFNKPYFHKDAILHGYYINPGINIFKIGQPCSSIPYAAVCYVHGQSCLINIESNIMTVEFYRIATV